jgi:primosomal protein N' (replication factor Y) (superfamily II helicase)
MHRPVVPGAVAPAAELPVARVAVDLALPHLDRPFDYLVSDGQSDAARPGCRVRVRFAGQLVDAVILERLAGSAHPGRLARIERVVSAEPVFAPEILTLARAAADRWAGTFADVARLAVPARHARAEAQPTAPAATTPEPPVAGLERYGDGVALRTRLAAGESPRGVWAVLPGDWPAELAVLARAALSSGRGVVVVVPDHRDVTRVDAALGHELGAGRHLTLTADLGPAERYRRFLAVRRGAVRCVVGTRAAVWAPVERLGLVVVWDDGDDLLAEPRAPYCHARDVAVLRAHLAGASAVLAGPSMSAEGAALLASGWAAAVEPTTAGRADSLPSVRAVGDDDVARDPAARAARLPSLAWQAIRAALDAGAPVLVQVPRSGYQPSLGCLTCRAPARCPACAGPLARRGDEAPPVCRWCGAVASAWRCPRCGGERLRAVVVGSVRTAEELGRAFPGVAVRTSGASAVLASVPGRPALVVATPGAEPVADGGFGAAVLLDAWATMGRADLRAGEEALRRWLVAASLVRPAAAGGRVVVVAPAELRPVQALVRWRPRWHAERELEERTTLSLPPAVRLAALTGPPPAVAELVGLADLPAGAELLGPVPAPGRGDERELERLLVRVERSDGAALASALHDAAAVRSARKAQDPVRIELDPLLVG